jgi:adenosylcobinamide-phosphate synthase
MYIIPAAFILDLLVGDPRWLPHPIRMMGRTIERLEPIFRRIPVPLFGAGIFFTASLVFGTWGTVYLVVSLAGSLHPLFKLLLEIILIFYCISARSLYDDALAVGQALRSTGLKAAKAKVRYIVGRDVEALDRTGVTRATVETVAENFVDGVISPLFFAALGGAPLALAFKMVSTLDSMVGYKNETYHAFGKASARLDDICNYIPARLSVPIIALCAHVLAGRGRAVLDTAIHEGSNHASPNAGYPEAAFAGALGVKLGGANHYHGKQVRKPYIGSVFNPPQVNHIDKACALMLFASMFGLCLFVLMQIVVKAI